MKGAHRNKYNVIPEKTGYFEFDMTGYLSPQTKNLAWAVDEIRRVAAKGAHARIVSFGKSGFKLKRTLAPNEKWMRCNRCMNDFIVTNPQDTSPTCILCGCRGAHLVYDGADPSTRRPRKRRPRRKKNQ